MRDRTSVKRAVEEPSGPSLADASPRGRPRSGVRRSQARLRHRRMRLFFFALAATWGFVTGSAAVIGALAFQDAALEIRLGFLTVLALAAAVAGAGGVVVAIVYREAVGRQLH